ncbi:glutamine-hydrolyzing carbamoyl-phosphate synthase small subunit [Myxococcota bacterium]|nr:glutamine-hydrolyzing carbamoyl-phosphate synthase small subunit [Myxococcota bacterium]
MPDQAVLVLEDGRTFHGEAFGARRSVLGEVVFNTCLSGYQEVLTDPSYSGQIVTMTASHVGNYGVNDEDAESRRPFAEGFVAREFSRVASNHRSTRTLQAYLEDAGIPAIHGIDTRALTRHLRDRGAMRGGLSTDGAEAEALLERVRAWPGLAGIDLGGRVSCEQAHAWPSPQPGPYHVVVYDFGVKHNILRHLAAGPARVTVVPARSSASQVLALRPDGVLLSNGPGDPEPVAAYAAPEVRELLGRVPIMGICLGIQILGLTLGGRTFKLPFGHHGGNHPVRNLHTGAVEITSQNHNYAVDPDSLPAGAVEVTHVNLNDGTLEGFRCRSMPVMAVQYHPEAAPGPHDSRYLFDAFFRLIEDWRGAR